MKTIPEILREEVKNSPDFIKPLMPIVTKALQTREWVPLGSENWKLAATISGERLKVSLSNEPVP